MSIDERPLDVLEPFVLAGVLVPVDVQVARAVARLTPGLDPAVLLAVALAVRATRRSHVCVILRDLPTQVVLDDATEEPIALDELPWPDPRRWAETLRASAVVRVVPPGSVVPAPGPDDPRMDRSTAQGGRPPLVFDGVRLYLDRYWSYEVAVAEQLVARAAAPALASTATPFLDPLFPPDLRSVPTSVGTTVTVPGAPPVVDRQRRAAEVALEQRLAVIAGGPGTGKTRTVACVLAAAIGAAAADGRVLDVALAAPTGKAAARMTEAIHGEAVGGALGEAVAGTLREVEATTIHQLLGWRDGVRFRHDRHDPLPADLVVIDEASMVSLPLMAKVLDAVRPDAQLVLVGDPFQLTSIDAGAVLGDIVGGALNGGHGPLAANVVVLDRVHRFGVDSAIAVLAAAVREGRTDDALAVLRSGAGDVVWIEPDDEAACRQVEDDVVATARGVVRAGLAGDARAGLAAAAERKVLAAVRRGPLSTTDWHERIERRLARLEPRARMHERWYPGRPVMVTRNDRLHALVNGDTGVVVEVEGERRVAFADGAGLRWVEPSQLADVDTWWTMTVHKSQGSEYRHVVLSLPGHRSPILTRELLYTAVTRARESLTIIATEEALRAAIDHPVTRATGLSARLWS